MKCTTGGRICKGAEDETGREAFERLGGPGTRSRRCKHPHKTVLVARLPKTCQESGSASNMFM